jgi:hypothetical protein
MTLSRDDRFHFFIDSRGFSATCRVVLVARLSQPQRVLARLQGIFPIHAKVGSWPQILIVHEDSRAARVRIYLSIAHVFLCHSSIQQDQQSELCGNAH